jgi:hypothetical protein
MNESFYKTIEYTNYTILFLLLMAIVSVALLVIIETATSEVTYINNTATCYDKFENPINNLTCKVEIECGIVGQEFGKEYCFSGTKRGD